MNAPTHIRLATSTALSTMEAPPAPQCVEIEAQVIGCIFMNPEVLAQIEPIVAPEHFFEDLHRQVYSVALELAKLSRPITLFTIQSYLADSMLGRDEQGVDVTTRMYLARVAAGAVPPSLAIDLARVVAEVASRREMIEVAEQLISVARDPHPSAKCMDLIEKPLQALQRIGESSASADTRRDAGESAASLISRARSKKDGTMQDAGISTGLPDLDRAMGGGFQPGTLVIIGGRPRMGKSVLGTGFARKVASRGAKEIELGRPGFGAQFFSLELPEDQIVARFLADMSYLPRRPITFGNIMSGNVDDEDIWALEDAQKRLAAMPLALDVAPALTVAEIAARVRAEKTKMARSGTRLAVVFIDYLKFIRASDRYKGNRVYEVGEISGALKQLAKAESVCIVLLAQVSRAVDKADRKDKAPNLSDLRDSGDLEADADVVLFIDRESVRLRQSAEYKKSDPDTLARFAELQHQADLIVAKTRVGGENTLSIWFDAGSSTFASHSREA